MFVNLRNSLTTITVIITSIIATFVLPFASTTDCTHQLKVFPPLKTTTASKASNGSSSVQAPGEVKDISSNGGYSFLEDSKKCDELLMQRLNITDVNNNGEEVESCSDGLLELDFIPHSVFPVGKNILPYIQLNISIGGKVAQIQQLFFQLRCLYAPNKDDYLCHNHGIQLVKWGKMIWPCRYLQLDDMAVNESTNFTFAFSYTCYRLFSLSQYQLEFFVVQRMESKPICRRTFLLTIPLERNLDPKISSFYTGEPASAAKWSPLLAVDTTPSDALLIQMSPADWIWPSRHINLSIFAQKDEMDVGADESDNVTHPNVHLLRSERIFPQKHNSTLWTSQQQRTRPPKFRWRWPDVESGNYTLYAFLDDGHCRLSCSTPVGEGENHGEAMAVGGCEPCPHTALNLTLAEAKLSQQWRRTRAMAAVAKHLAVAVFVILLLILLLLIVVFLYVRLWRPRVLARQRARSVELLSRPTVLVLYTDDCQPHCDSVMALCRLLEQSANARCFVDQTEFLADPTLRPSVWLVDKLSACDFVLTIFSACSSRVLAGERMHQRRHFPDYFNTAIGFVVAKINEIASSEGVLLLPKQQKLDSASNENRSSAMATMTATAVNGTSVMPPSSSSSAGPASRLGRFIFTRFDYSPAQCIPAFFASSQFSRGGPLVLPQHMGLLIARLHGLSGDEPLALGNGSHSRFEHQADLDPLNTAIAAFREFDAKTPDWMSERFEMGREDEAKGDLSPDLPQSMHPKRVPTMAEQAALAERFGLLKPDDDEEEDQTQNGGDEDDTGIPRSLANAMPAGSAKRYQLLGSPEDFDSSNSSLNDVG